MSETTTEKKVNQKDFVKKEGTVIKYNDRKWIEILEDTKHLRKGAIMNPHKIHADAYINAKIAKAIDAPKKVKRAKKK